jgi:hypothetical protein
MAIRNRKGTEKPIEIFVALFIILAVALVMLKLFQSQISEKQKELADVQQEQKSKELREKVELSCQEKCTQASNNGCSLQSLASLCIFGSPQVLAQDQFVDLNNDKLNGYDDTLLAGIGVCEDNLYCFHVMGSCCAREISARSCRTILHDYWLNKGIISSDADMATRLGQLVPAGSCQPPPGAVSVRWDRRPEWNGTAA